MGDVVADVQGFLAIVVGGIERVLLLTKSGGVVFSGAHVQGLNILKRLSGVINGIR